MQQSMTLSLMGSILTLILSVPIHANEDQERADLSLLLVEMDALFLVINRAEHSSDVNARRQFDYQTLRRDLHQVRQGIQEHLNRVRRNPRELPAIQGEYH